MKINLFSIIPPEKKGTKKKAQATFWALLWQGLRILESPMKSGEVGVSRLVGTTYPDLSERFTLL